MPAMVRPSQAETTTTDAAPGDARRVDCAAMASKQQAQPAAQPVPPAEILEREGKQRMIAAWLAVASAVVTAIAVLLEQLVVAGGVPNFQHADLAATMAATQQGNDLPRSFLTAVGEFQIEHAAQTTAIGTLRGIALMLLIPIVLLLLRGARDRGAPIVKLLDAIVIAGLAMAGILAVATAALEPNFYREARDAGFSPEAIRDAYQGSGLVSASYLGLFASLMAGIPISMASIQAMRVGLLPRLIGFMGVLIGILFVMPLEPTGILRSVWFGAVAFIIAGRFGDGLPEAWKTGKAVELEPRQPRKPSLEKA